jgi:hypothetical protein
MWSEFEPKISSFLSSASYRLGHIFFYLIPSEILKVTEIRDGG